MKKTYIYFNISLFVLLSSCNFLDIKPVGQVIPKTTTEYRALINSAYFSIPEHKALLSMRGYELSPEDDPWGMGLDGFGQYKSIYTWDDLNYDPLTVEFHYISFYKIIFITNVIIAEINNAIEEGDETKEQILSEAYMLRAYMHFELVNMYAPVYEKDANNTHKAIPIYKKIDVEQKFSRNTVEEVYEFILSDLKKAEGLAKIKRREDAKERYRFSQEAFYALKSRVFLFMKNWESSLEAAKEVMNISKELEDMNSDEYVSNTSYESKESILALESTLNDALRNYASISEDFLKLYSEKDLRPAKYFSESESGAFLQAEKCVKKSERVSFRRSEVFLNAAEAAAHLGELTDAKAYLFELMKHRYTAEGWQEKKDYIETLSREKLIVEILNERKKELALEGHLWYDLRRTGQPQINKKVKGVEYLLQENDSRYVLQIPKSARDENPYLNE